MAVPEAELLPQIRLLALTGRGIQFLELGRFKAALMDFQYSLQVSPGTFSMKVRKSLLGWVGIFCVCLGGGVDLAKATESGLV